MFREYLYVSMIATLVLKICLFVQLCVAFPPFGIFVGSFVCVLFCLLGNLCFHFLCGYALSFMNSCVVSISLHIWKN